MHLCTTKYRNHPKNLDHRVKFLRSATDGAKYARHGIHREVPRADPGDRCKLVRRRREASFVLGEQCIKEWASEKNKGGDTQGMHKAQVRRV